MILVLMGVLSLIMIATRFPFGGEALHLLDASWALFFILGRLSLATSIKWISFFWFALLAWVIDLLAVQGDFVNAYCMTPAYIGMPLAYAALMGLGHLSQGQGVFHFEAGQLSRGHMGLVLSVAAAATLAFFITNLFFYLGSGYFGHLEAATYAGLVVKYFPDYALTMFMYLAGWHAFNRFRPVENDLAAHNPLEARS